jgi:protein CpxP
MKSTLRFAALSALVALGAASGAQAQAPSEGDHHGRPMAGQMPGQMQAQMRAMHEARGRQRAQDLRTVLRLRPDQEPALTAFLASHRPPMPPPEHRGPPGDGAMTMTTPQRLDETARREAEHAGLRLRHADALRAFYAALSPEQRQVFDALQRMQHGGGGGHGGGDRGGWSHDGFGGPGHGPHGPMGGPPGGPPPRDD